MATESIPMDDNTNYYCDTNCDCYWFQFINVSIDIQHTSIAMQLNHIPKIMKKR